MPHFRRAVAIGKVVDLCKVVAATLADALDGLAAGIFLVDADARVVHANRRGHAMLTDGDILKDIGGKLSAMDLQANQSMRDVFAAADAGDAAVGAKGLAVPLMACDGDCWVAHVLPLTSGARRQAGASYAAVAAVFVRKAALDLPPPLQTLAELYTYAGRSACGDGDHRNRRRARCSTRARHLRDDGQDTPAARVREDWHKPTGGPRQARRWIHEPALIRRGQPCGKIQVL